MTAGDWTTKEAFKAWSKIAPSTDDGLLDTLITQASEMLTEEIGRDPFSTSHTATFSGRGQDKAFVEFAPISAVASVTVDGAAVPLSSSPLIGGYVFDPDAVYLRPPYRFLLGVQNCVIAYTGGWVTLPAGLVACANHLVLQLYRLPDRQDLESRTIGTETSRYRTMKWPDQMRAHLDNAKPRALLP